MAQSREQLTMDMTKSENSIFSYPRGFFVTRVKAVIILLAFIVIAVGVGLVTYYVTKDATEKELIHGGGGESDANTGQKPGGGSGGGRKKVMDVRLPENILPIYYKLELIPYVEEAKNFTLDGKAWIDVKCIKATEKITLHLKNISIKKDTVSVTPIREAELPVSNVRSEDGGSLAVQKHEFDEDREFYNITVSPGLEEGKLYRIFIEYTGMLDDSLGGFYRSSYIDKDTKEKRYIGVTQFQATDARRAFPCFDEPALKAKFEVSLARRSNMSSIANMDRKNTAPIPEMDGWVWDHYNKSVPMSTYLVAFVVSDFENRMSNRSLSKPEFRVWARSSAIDQAEYARDIGPRILTYFEKYFGIEFPLPKQDMIAIPDFGAGAMENWGLITYRESAMLYDANASSDQNKLRVATVISHELAHQWFGNLVTPKWWNDLWLNEGFASYVEYIGVDHISPDWKILEQFVSDEVHNVFKLDALESSHPISVPVNHPDEISEIFDRISYGKGASIIRMMNHFLTEATFKQGLHNYLMKWTYQAAVQNDLWDSLTEQAHADGTLDRAMTVHDVMDTWTLQKGFPTIKVERNYNDGSATFSQAKFLIQENATKSKEYESYKWWVPISYASKIENTDFESTKPNLWLSKEQSSVTDKINVDESSWVIVNVQQTGYYRVNYDERNWQLIINQLMTNFSAIHTVNRAQLLDDAFNLASANVLDYKLAFNMTVYLKEDSEYLPWETFLDAFGYIGQMLSKSPIHGTFKAFVRDLVHKQYQRVGFTESSSDPLLLKLHRTNMIRWACNMEHEDCIANAAQLFTTWMNKADPDNDNPIPTNFRRTIYCSAIKRGGQKEWDFLWQRYLKSNVASDKSSIMISLSCSKDPWILNRYLLWATSEGSGIRKQDGPSVVRTVASQEIGNYVAFNFIREKWLDMRKYFGSGFFGIAPVITAVAGRLNTPFELLEIENFRTKFRDHLGSATRVADQAVESVTANVKWMDDNYKTISAWLENQVASINDNSQSPLSTSPSSSSPPSSESLSSTTAPVTATR
ncbi:unnamed protein product [Orchesella dallaii]|uniref:Aminopeptidase n=1 Tax=Orchesella dallaii TaxID=48710 RepID=A0ABP1QNM1_9HEXA